MIASLRKQALAGQCELLYFDEAGFSPNPPVQYGWSRVGQTRCVVPQAHQQLVNVLGALRHDGKLMWVARQRPTVRDDVIAFFDCLSEQPHPVPCIVVIDNAAIHKGEVMEGKREQWARRGLYLYYLPPYRSELNQNLRIKENIEGPHIKVCKPGASLLWREALNMKNSSS